RHVPQGDLGLADFVSLIDQLPDLTSVHLTGEGEPLMNPAFIEMIAEARRRGLKVAFITNGSLMTPPIIERLVELRPSLVGISLESLDPVAFRRIPGVS